MGWGNTYKHDVLKNIHTGLNVEVNISRRIVLNFAHFLSKDDLILFVLNHLHILVQ